MLNEFEIGKELPDWELTSIFNDEIPMKNDLLGKPLVILFFSLGCPGCLGRAIPYANRIVVENGDSFNVIGIHTHFEGAPTAMEDLKKAKDEYYIKFPYFSDFGLASTFYKYVAGGTPHWIVVDENGFVRDSIFGSDPNRALLRLDYLIDEIKHDAETF